MVDEEERGPIGDGVADDTDALQSLLDKQRGVPPGTYRITRSLIVRAQRHRSLDLSDCGAVPDLKTDCAPAVERALRELDDPDDGEESPR